MEKHLMHVHTPTFLLHPCPHNSPPCLPHRQGGEAATPSSFLPHDAQQQFRKGWPPLRNSLVRFPSAPGAWLRMPENHLVNFMRGLGRMLLIEAFHSFSVR